MIDIPEYEGIYKFDNELNQVFSIKTNRYLKNTLNVNSLQVTLFKNGKAKISSIMPMKKGDPIAEQITPSVVFSMEDFQAGKKEVFNNLSEGIRNIILRSKELEGMNQDQGDEGNGASVGDSPIPF